MNGDAPSPSQEHPRWVRWIAAVGIVVGPGRWQARLRPRFFGIVGGLGLFALLSLLGVATYSEQPRFCNSCHIMEPYYKAWKASKHNSVACVECHYPPGAPKTILWKKFQALSQVVKYVTRTYSSKPFAEVDDSACLRPGCHSTRLLKGRVVSEKGIKFDHRPHLTQERRGRHLRCTSCHSQIVMGKHIEVTWDTCFLCHFKGHTAGGAPKPVGGCLGCHELPTRAITIGNMTYRHADFVTKRGVACQDCHRGVVQGDGAVPQDRCYTCHNQPEKLARYGDQAAMHEHHVTRHHIACFHCHQEIRHGFSGGRGDSHARTAIVSDCETCHSKHHDVQKQFYAGLGMPDVGEMPSPMFLAGVDCAGCHVPWGLTGGAGHLAGGTTTYAGGGCERCHGEKFRGVVDETKALMAETVGALTEKVAKARAAGGLSDEGARLVGRASERVSLVRQARGHHNVYFASALLRRANEELDRAGVAGLPDLSDRPLISGGFCATLCHPKIGVKVPPETVTFAGRVMPHRRHWEQGMACVTCHEFGRHKQVRLKVAKKDCETCHAL